MGEWTTISVKPEFKEQVIREAALLKMSHYEYLQKAHASLMRGGTRKGGSDKILEEVHAMIKKNHVVTEQEIKLLLYAASASDSIGEWGKEFVWGTLNNEYAHMAVMFEERPVAFYFRLSEKTGIEQVALKHILASMR